MGKTITTKNARSIYDRLGMTATEAAHRLSNLVTAYGCMPEGSTMTLDANDMRAVMVAADMIGRMRKGQRQGGSSQSKKKVAASRKNGRLGGKPPAAS